MVLSVDGYAPRVVVSGVGGSGRSCAVRDGGPFSRLDGAIASAANVWWSDSVPATAGAMPSENAEYELLPPVGGVSVLMVALAPEAELQGPSAYADGLSQMGVDGTGYEDAAGFHQTSTVDVVTVLSGELTALLEDGEVLLRSGEVLVQRGTAHAWRNLGTEPAVVTITMIDASTTT